MYGKQMLHVSLQDTRRIKHHNSAENLGERHDTENQRSKMEMGRACIKNSR